jgi:XTP/dITP diphosphohydrolase
MSKLIFASQNSGKIKEVKSILFDSNLEIISLIDLNDFEDILEDGITFEENARKKALHVYNKYKVPVIADDSGLSVEQLNGRPGVYSARYSGENATSEHNNLKLIEELRDKPAPHYAAFICFAVYYDGMEFISADGEVKGAITLVPKGNSGFGYDPLFIPQNYERTMAELDPKEKNKISHRSIAFSKLKIKLKGIL